MKRRTRDWKAIGRVTAAILLVPALVVAVCTVQHSRSVAAVAVVIGLWSEYRLGFMK